MENTRSVNRKAASLGAAVSLLLAAYLASAFGWRQAALFGVGLGAGLVLYHAAFGFTSAWREIVVNGRGAGIRAQMLMLALTVLVFTPLIAQGELWGTALRGNVYPLNLAVVFGAFVFGIGMQLGAGCASGTLFTAGGGNTKMLITLLAFIAGSVIGAWHWTAWQDAAGLEPISLLDQFGVAAAIAISLLIFTGIWIASMALERRRHGAVRADRASDSTYSWLRGPWPLIAGAIGLCAVNVATLALAGRPWGITSGFALWGSKALDIAGVDVASWAYWERPSYATALAESVFANITSVMNFGIVLGAFLAAGLAGRFAPAWKIPGRAVASAVVGGLLMGYGARIAFGCNIGAFFSGVASASLSGWLWFVAAFAGSAVGIRLRSRFALA
ncbi:MAG TPA: YeeE/YedE family protein [Gammaproteobacteria bacterium]|jgi:uncharacterized membrane protein YedE/YeeE